MKKTEKKQAQVQQTVQFKITRLNQKLETLKQKVKRANPAFYTTYVDFEEKIDGYNLRIRLIENYLEELEEVSAIVSNSERVVIVPNSTLEKKLERADFTRVEFEGDYVRIVCVYNYPEDYYYFIALAPLARFS